MPPGVGLADESLELGPFIVVESRGPLGDDIGEVIAMNADEKAGPALVDEADDRQLALGLRGLAGGVVERPGGVLLAVLGFDEQSVMRGIGAGERVGSSG